jgi:hypothetical protein
MKSRLLRSLLINGAVIVGLCALVEFGSWAAIKIYTSMRSGTADAAGVVFQPEKSAATGANDPLAVYSSPDVPADLSRNAEMPGSPYRYSSYLVYGNRPYQSKNLNIAPDGMRLNGPTPPPSGEATDVWVFGSSPTFGGSNGDSETIPANLERALAERLPGRKIRVSNFGVVGYTSWQEMLNFAHRLSERPKPKLVIFINGINDHQLAWLNASEDCEMLFQTAVGSSSALTAAWEVQATKQFILWPTIYARLASYFPNTLELRKLAIKYFEWKQANRNVAEWKEQYRQRRDRDSAVAKRCLGRAEGIYLRNMGMAARLATDNGIDVAFVHDPMLLMTKKPLVGAEVTERETANYNNFALSDEELAALREVPTYRIDQAYVWDRSLYFQSYAEQKQALHALADRLGVRFVEFEPVIDQAGPVAIFSTRIHYTFRGARLVGDALADAVVDRLKN